MKHEIKEGGILYCVEQPHPYKDNRTFECEVTKLSKTIVYTSCRNRHYDGCKFNLKNLKHTQWNDTRAFLTEDERNKYLVDCELQKKIKSMLSELNFGKYTRKQLTDIANILNLK